jgi:hypothetical protein
MGGEASEASNQPFHRGIGGGMRAQGDRGNTGSPLGWPGVSGQPETREGQTGPLGGGGWARMTDEAGGYCQVNGLRTRLSHDDGVG